jgi:hypothetical protein
MSGLSMSGPPAPMPGPSASPILQTPPNPMTPPPLAMSGAHPTAAAPWPQAFGPGPGPRGQKESELVLHPSERRPPSTLVIVAISIAAFLVVSMSVATCLFLSAPR